MTSNWMSPMAQLIASSPLATTTHRQPSRARIVSRILELIGLSSAIKQSTVLSPGGGTALGDPCRARAALDAGDWFGGDCIAAGGSLRNGRRGELEAELSPPTSLPSPIAPRRASRGMSLRGGEVAVPEKDALRARGGTLDGRGPNASSGTGWTADGGCSEGRRECVGEWAGMTGAEAV